MKAIRLELVLALALLGGSATQAAAGQRPPKAPHAGEDVIVTQSGSGEELRGHLVELSSTSLAMLVDGRRVEIPIDNVLRIDARTDSLANGALIGAAVMGSLAGLMCASFEGEAGPCVTGIVIDTGFGALIGAGIDALHKGRSPIYVKAGKGGSSLQVRIRF